MDVKVTKGQIFSGTISKICHKEYYLCEKFHAFFTNSTDYSGVAKGGPGRA